MYKIKNLEHIKILTYQLNLSKFNIINITQGPESLEKSSQISLS